MSKAKQAMLMAKMAKKGEIPSLSTVSTENDGKDFRGIKDGVKDSGPFPTAKTGGSLGLIKSVKAGKLGGDVPSAALMGEQEVPSAELMGEQPVMKAKKGSPYSPIKTYLRGK